ncbi:MAG: hypothetical protein V1644_01705 [Candidatus Micrarchaeota archaeon]
MVSLISNDIFTSLSVIASVLVLLYVIGYVLMSWMQAKKGDLRPDWSISLVFYIGIAVLALGYLAQVSEFCIGSLCFNSAFEIAYLVSIVLFVYGFEKRSGAAVKVSAKLANSKTSVNKRKK